MNATLAVAKRGPDKNSSLYEDRCRYNALPTELTSQLDAGHFTGRIKLRLMKLENENMWKTFIELQMKNVLRLFLFACSGDGCASCGGGTVYCARLWERSAFGSSYSPGRGGKTVRIPLRGHKGHGRIRWDSRMCFCVGKRLLPVTSIHHIVGHTGD